jgi:hypothetical protein
VGFEVVVRFVFSESTRELAYTIDKAGPQRDEVAGVYLHRRAGRPNGGVAHVLAKTPGPSFSGTVTLLDGEVADLKAGKCYVSAISKRSPLVGVRADIRFPSAPLTESKQ